jgi:hypothetical protein
MTAAACRLWAGGRWWWRCAAAPTPVRFCLAASAHAAAPKCKCAALRCCLVTAGVRAGPLCCAVASTLAEACFGCFAPGSYDCHLRHRRRRRRCHHCRRHCCRRHSATAAIIIIVTAAAAVASARHGEGGGRGGARQGHRQGGRPGHCRRAQPLQPLQAGALQLVTLFSAEHSCNSSTRVSRWLAPGMIDCAGYESMLLCRRRVPTPRVARAVA